MLIAIVDDESIMCRSIAAVLEATGQSHVVEQFSGKHCGAAVLKWLEFHRPDYCILDVLLNGISGLDVAKFVIDRWPDPRILLITGCADDSEYHDKAQNFASKHDKVNCILKRESGEGKTFISTLLEDLNSVS